MSLPVDAVLVDFCAAIYQPGHDWDHLDDGKDDGICWGLKHLDHYDVVVFRGSVTSCDWAEDFKVVAYDTGHIGMVHRGFYDGMPRVWNELSKLARNPIIVTGHSLGAARADVLCALMVADGKMPVRRTVFGEPRPGFPDFADYVSHVPGVSYRNADRDGHDYVTDVPFPLCSGFNFVRPTPLVDVTAAPDPTERLSPFRYHHIPLYQAAMKAKETTHV